MESAYSKDRAYSAIISVYDIYSAFTVSKVGQYHVVQDVTANHMKSIPVCKTTDAAVN